MTKIHKWIYTICVFLLVSFICAVALGQYSDYKNCLCSIATTEHQTRTIDDLLRAYYEPNPDSGIEAQLVMPLKVKSLHLSEEGLEWSQQDSNSESS